MRAILRVNTIITILILMRPYVLVAQDKPKEEISPSSALIEFLGEFKDDDVGYVDPMSLLKMDSRVENGLKAQEGGDEKE